MDGVQSDNGGQEVPTDRECRTAAERARMRARLQNLTDQREAAIWPGSAHS